ncbi:MAG: hypothetical protein ACRDYC_06645 [Acidimicrobiales bacterium]
MPYCWITPGSSVHAPDGAFMASMQAVIEPVGPGAAPTAEGFRMASNEER